MATITKGIAIAAMLALGLAGSAQASSVLKIDPDGLDTVDGVKMIAVLDWNVGNALIQNIESDTPQTYSHGALSAFNDASGNLVGSGIGSGAYEWTFVLGSLSTKTQTVDAVDGLGNPTQVTTTLTTMGGGENFFRIYYGVLGAKNSDNLPGTGFNDGVLILSGTVRAGGKNDFIARDLNGVCDSGLSNCATLGLNPSDPIPLDKFPSGLGNNNYPGINSVSGTGSGSLTVDVGYADPLFFLDIPDMLLLDTNTDTHLPFTKTNPSEWFTNAANATILPGAQVSSVGTCNGCLSETAPNVMAQIDPSSSFGVAEPGTLMLLGLGLGLVSTVHAIRRRRSTTN